MELSKRLLRLSWRVKVVRKIYGRVTGRLYESDFERIPGMTTLEERDFFYATARQTTGKGHIVDLGCWLGSTTIPLLKGLRDSNAGKSANNIKVYAFDRFVWDKDMQEVVNWYPHVGYITPGSDFKELFETGVADYKDLVEVVRADLSTYYWYNGPIELLLIDAMKSFNLTLQIARAFMPNVTDGGIIIFQDFAHYYTSWLHFITYELRNSLQPVVNVAHSGSMVFKKAGNITPEQFNFLADIKKFDKSYINRVFDHSVALANPENKYKVVAAKAMWYVHDNDIEEAKRVYENEIDRKHRNEEDVLNLRRYLPK